jgi:regulator of protease activity HflC (stomatin/prohibitin superfamily)
VTEPSTSAVEQAVQARIAAARIKVQAAQQQRDELSAARRRGIAARHANKLRHLAEAEQRQADEPDGQNHADHRASVRTTDGSATPTGGAANTTEGDAP